ncbi:ABC transporter ATP-binding protein/permease [Sporomusa acidovorans]|uniref:Vitamin B12 transport ATP-binding protein BacA n=1 Tax=Sporomusa acidovorans (strain ATCC 49682 / DSM 3132 / Mol) TaxID=1123286 RepID=A0ABZ3IYG9_SPOA4|nr:ABC transporter ATP-binding protein/permease [Sporomusa acidovorans]OZC17633.1 vitamin B12 transport ATP-binding protein BacA [Sporomusa acidovorans DSM 3132]SDE10136.1 putative ATP-binding cassette transporter [Sporomusa acidovorans]
MVKLALSYWLSAVAPKAWILSLFLVFCTGLLAFLNMQLNNWQVDFYNHLQQHNLSGFFQDLVQFVIITSILVTTSGWQTHSKMLLQICWRQWLTNTYISLWLHNQTYFRIKFTATPIDNPDQRIEEDIQLFVTHSLDLAVGLLRHLVTLVIFSAVLWKLSGDLTILLFGTPYIIPGYLVWSALLYSAFGTWITVKIGRPLMILNNIQQSNEADFRYKLVRVKEYAECIALYRGACWEKNSLFKNFSRIIATYLAMIKTTRNITWISSAYTQLSTVFAFLIASPRYFNDELQLGQLFEIAGAYWYVHSALSYIIESFGKFAQWRAVTDRLRLFYAQLKSLEQMNKKTLSICNHNTLLTKELSIFSPAGHILINKLSLEVTAGDSLLITGPSGCGKSTLLQTLAGIWPYFDGRISLPSHSGVLFLPQKPYLPVDSLRNVVLYPQKADLIPDTKIKEALTICKLNGLLSQLDMEADWSKTLSLGELQRLALVRAFIHQPKWLFLDEITACIDADTEAQIYQVLREKLPHSSLISIGHRDSLKVHHRRILELNGTGDWRCFEQPQASAAL